MISESMRSAAIGAFDEDEVNSIELFDMGVASGQLDVMYAIRHLGTNPSSEALETVLANFDRKIRAVALGYLFPKEDDSK